MGASHHPDETREPGCSPRWSSRMSELFDLAMKIGQRLLGRGVDVETAMEVMETIRAFAKMEEAKVEEARAAKRDQDARNAKAYRERKKGASASIILTET